MWFPEVLRELTSMGAEVILHPVLTGTNDREIELNLARSSGALFQSYIIDINGLGVGGVGQSCIVDPSGHVIHQAGETNEFLVTELDFDLVRRQREVGLRSLGQPLKSFRDRKINFTVYNQEQGDNSYLNTLGPMQKPTRTTKTNKAIEPSLVMQPIENLISPIVIPEVEQAEPAYENFIAEVPTLTHLDLPLSHEQTDTYETNIEPGEVNNQYSKETEPTHINDIERVDINVNSSFINHVSKTDKMISVDEFNNVEADNSIKINEQNTAPGNNNDDTESGWIKGAAAQLKQYIKS